MNISQAQACEADRVNRCYFKVGGRAPRMLEFGWVGWGVASRLAGHGVTAASATRA